MDGATVYAIDTNRERDLLIGRAWPYQALSIGEALVQEGLARQMRGVNVGDTIVLNLRLNNLLPLVHWQAINASGIPQSYPGPSVNVAVKVVGILPLTYGKVSASDDKGVFIELDTLLELVARSVPSTAFPAPFPALFASDASLELMYQSVTAVLFTCGSVRLDCYGSSSYPTTAALVMDWASAIVRRLSFTQVNSELPVLGELSQLQVFSAFLGMVFSLVTILLSVLSIFLIYSLLMASVATKTFELGVLRMIGMSRRGVVSLILVGRIRE